ncbi:hypothetical protein, partial [Bacteroides heparinolyticus]|uniref:hypothetical protein n=1 Tax=Prevotella heparinolytica TaxID=28113 RepID=UPI0035A07FB1
SSLRAAFSPSLHRSASSFSSITFSSTRVCSVNDVGTKILHIVEKKTSVLFLLTEACAVFYFRKCFL